MTRSEQILEIVNRINVAKEDVAILTAHQNGHYDWEEMTELLVGNHVSNLGFSIFINGFTSWVNNQKHNKLPNSSSGSFMTALKDFDNLVTPLFESDELLMEFGNLYYNQVFGK